MLVQQTVRLGQVFLRNSSLAQSYMGINEEKSNLVGTYLLPRDGAKGTKVDPKASFLYFTQNMFINFLLQMCLLKLFALKL